jgi:hypothetical protein
MKSEATLKINEICVTWRNNPVTDFVSLRQVSLQLMISFFMQFTNYVIKGYINVQ